MTKKWLVRVLPRAEVLDVQGRAVKDLLQQNGLEFSNVRVGRLIELSVSEKIPNVEEALKKALSLGLFNPLIEVAEVDALDDKSSRWNSLSGSGAKS
jgi:phosphoribosylformylglycinamidine (FGAM) synthase PurS component